MEMPAGQVLSNIYIKLDGSNHILANVNSILFIQHVYFNTYNLKSHTRFIMVPQHFSSTDPNSPVYYPLSYPALLKYSLNPKQLLTIIEDMREIKYLIDLLETQLKSKLYTFHELIKDVYSIFLLMKMIFKEK